MWAKQAIAEHDPPEDTLYRHGNGGPWKNGTNEILNQYQNHEKGIMSKLWEQPRFIEAGKLCTFSSCFAPRVKLTGDFHSCLTFPGATVFSFSIFNFDKKSYTSPQLMDID